MITDWMHARQANAHGHDVRGPHRRPLSGPFQGIDRVRSADRTLPEQRLDQRAFRQRAVSTLRDNLLEHPLHAL